MYGITISQTSVEEIRKLVLIWKKNVIRHLSGLCDTLNTYTYIYIYIYIYIYMTQKETMNNWVPLSA